MLVNEWAETLSSCRRQFFPMGERSATMPAMLTLLLLVWLPIYGQVAYAQGIDFPGVRISPSRPKNSRKLTLTHFLMVI